MNFFEPTDNTSLTTAFPNLPFRLRHHFTGNPLLTLPKLAELVRELPRDRIEYNSGKAAINQKPETTPTVDLDPEEIVRKIETAGAWMVLKHVGIAARPIAKLIEDALLEVARDARLRDSEGCRLRGYSRLHLRVVGAIDHAVPCRRRREFLLPGAWRQVFPCLRQSRPLDRFGRGAGRQRRASIATCPTIRNSTPKCTTYNLKPGDGVFVPYQWPHWVRTADSYSISLSLTWKSPEVRQRNDIFTVNSMLRGLGMPQSAPGTSPALDAAKLARVRTAAGAVAPLRRSEGMRRVIRRLALRPQRQLLLPGGASKDTPDAKGVPLQSA